MPKPSGPFKPVFYFGKLVLLVCIFISYSSLAQSDTAHAKATSDHGLTLNGLKEGVWRFLYPDGSLMATETYRKGELNGLSTGYFPDGKVSTRENWKDDLQEDSAWYYHPNGQLHRKGVYEKGVYQGVWMTYFPNGKPEQKISYVDGLPEGDFVNWLETGELLEEGYYLAGKKEGQFLRYYSKPAGKVKQISHYRNDQPSGTWFYFTKRGKLAYSERMSQKN